MSAHGPDATSTARAMAAELGPVKLDNTLAFMFETRQVLRPTSHPLVRAALQPDYDQVWDGLPRMFGGGDA